jgi:ankyrin repeat protein
VAELSCDNSALLLAAVKGHKSAVEALLIDARVDINATDSSGDTALHYAARRGDLDLAQILLKHPNIKPNIRSKNETSGDENAAALHIAASRGHNYNRDDNSIRWHSTNSYRGKPAHPGALGPGMIRWEPCDNSIRRDNSNRADTNYNQDHNYNSFVEALLTNARVDVNATDANGDTALHYAVGRDDLELTKILLKRY